MFAACTALGEDVVDENKAFFMVPEGPNGQLVPLKGIGCWKDRNALSGLMSALDHLHGNAHLHKSEYSHPCDACRRCQKDAQARYDEWANQSSETRGLPPQRSKGCSIHHPFPRVTGSGNVTRAVPVMDAKSYLLKTSSHIKNGAKPYPPKEARKILLHAIHNNNKYSFSLAVEGIEDVSLENHKKGRN